MISMPVTVSVTTPTQGKKFSGKGAAVSSYTQGICVVKVSNEEAYAAINARGRYSGTTEVQHMPSKRNIVYSRKRTRFRYYCKERKKTGWIRAQQ